MGKFNLGSVRPDQIYIGNELVEAIYVGSDKVWPIGIRLVAAPGEYLVSGRPLAIGGEFSIAMEMGSFTHTGNDLAFVRDRMLKAVAGSYTTTGNEAVFGFGKIIQLAAGSFTYTGNDLGFVRDRVMKGVAGSYTISGSVLAAKAQRKISLAAGSYAVTGNAADLTVGSPSGIEFVGVAAAGKVGDTSGTSTIALNSGLTGGIASAVSAGDIVIAVFATCSTTDRTLSITDGTTDYTLLDTELYADDNFDTNLRVAYKVMGATPDTTTTFGPTGNAADAGTMAVYVLRGVDTAGITTATATGINSLLADPPSITPTVDGSFIVCVGSGAHGLGTYTSGDLTNFVSQNQNDTNRSVIGVGHKPDWVSGAFDAAAFTFSGSDSVQRAWAAMSIVLPPA